MLPSRGNDKGAEGSKTREQESKRSSTCKGAEVQGTTGKLRITGGPWLQGHSTGGEGGQGLIWHFLPGAGQALGNGELLRGTEQESECRSTWKIMVCGGPCA